MKKLTFVRVGFQVLDWTKKTAVLYLVDARPFKLFEVFFSGFLTIAFLCKASECFSGSA